jgi:hypothetical protein
LDGTFKHPVQIEDNVTKHDLTCHSKSRRNKKKKIPLCTGEEVDMDLSAMELVLIFLLQKNVLNSFILISNLNSKSAFTLFSKALIPQFYGYE